jgi:MFS family permease
MGVPIGLLLSTAVFTTVSHVLTDDELMAWGWRIPFLASAIMIIIGSYIRHRLEESPEFIEAKKTQTVAERAPIAEVFVTHWKLVLQIAGMRTMQNTMFNVLTVFLLSYISKTLGMPKTVGLNALMLASTIGALGVPFWGWMTDLYGRKRVALIGAICATTWALPLLLFVDTKSIVLITTAMVIAALIHDIAYASQAVYIAELFPTRVRLTGANVSYSMGSVFAGCLIPVLPIILDSYGIYGIGILLIGVGLVSTLCTLSLRETLRK